MTKDLIRNAPNSTPGGDLKIELILSFYLSIYSFGRFRNVSSRSISPGDVGVRDCWEHSALLFSCFLLFCLLAITRQREFSTLSLLYIFPARKYERLWLKLKSLVKQTHKGVTLV